jgi:thiamine kinase-like enzyme
MLRTQTAAASLALASEACLSAAELVRQINQRLLRLQRDAIADHNFQAFLSHQLAPRVTRWRADAEAAYDRLNWSFSAPVAAAARTLSPSDFGFHNAIQTADNRLTFIDFEYFGWDDPVKIAADFMLHPGMNLTDDQGQRFCTALTEIFGSSDGPDAAFATRLKILLPLYRLRWCFIILNEFLPDRWQRRQAAGNQQQRQTVLAQQLVKAIQMLDRH